MNHYITILQAQCQPNKYFRTYISICLNSLNRIKPEVTEKHHILPKCFGMGGEADVDNIAFLTPREHFICHKLLTKFITDRELKSKLTYAVWQFTKRRKISSREYENLKKLLSEAYKGIPKSEEHKNKLKKPKTNKEKMGRQKGCQNLFKGKKRPVEVGLKISQSKKGKNTGSKNHFYGKSHSQKTKEYLSDINKGKIVKQETKNKISTTLKGRTPWNKGIGVTEEVKQKASLSLSGRKNITNGFINKRVKLENLNEYLSNGWRIGFVNSTD